MSFQIILGERKKKVHPLSREMKLLSHQGKCFTGPCSPGCAEWHPWKCFMPSPVLGQQGKHPGSSTRAGSAFYLLTRQGYKSYSKWRRMAGSNLEPNQKKKERKKKKLFSDQSQTAGLKTTAPRELALRCLRRSGTFPGTPSAGDGSGEMFHE